jgi:hypothetical protein
MSARCKQTGDRCNRCKTLPFFEADISSYSENESEKDYVSEFATSSSVEELTLSFPVFLLVFQVNCRVLS